MIDEGQQGGFWSVLAHKLNSYLAFRVARLSGLAQSIDKLPHERPTAERPRLWTLPLVAPSILSLAAAARVMDRVLHESDDALGYMVVARRRPRAEVRTSRA